MDNLESIDKYLVSEIDGMDTIPSDQVWNSIHAKLDAGKAARKIRSRNWKIAGLSTLAVATVSVITYATLSQPKESPKNTTADKAITTVANQNIVVPSSEDTKVVTTITTEEKSNPAVQNATAGKSASTEKNSLIKTEETKDVAESSISGKQDASLKSAVITTTSAENKKDNSDKGIIMLPYFAPNYAGTDNSQNDKTSVPPPSVNSKIDPAETTPKVDPKENTIYMPNAFTPNGDGLNDVFLPQTAETPSEYKLSVFDRTGNLVFFSDDIQKGWDGRMYKNGLEEVKEDVYIWRIEMKTAKGEKRHLMGSLTLLK